MSTALPTAAQILALLLLGLVAGSMFGIWRGFDFTTYTPATYVEVHQGSVRGLNVLLPAMAMASIVLVLLLAVLARHRPAVWGLYLAAALAMVAAGLVTRFLNQPINARIMAWTPQAMPADWTALRDSWWHWHLVRLASAAGAQILLIAAIFVDRQG